MEDLRTLKHQGLRSGVYIFRNMVNFKCYVGSSVHLYTRLANYFYINNSPWSHLSLAKLWLNILTLISSY